jgi:hypothetical protein
VAKLTGRATWPLFRLGRGVVVDEEDDCCPFELFDDLDSTLRRWNVEEVRPLSTWLKEAVV